LGAAAVAVGGAISVQTGLNDRADYTERAARDLATTADIVTWNVHDVEVSCAEYELPPCHRTRTDIVVNFTTADGRLTSATLGSWGAYERHGSTRLGIVYDPAEPNDVDFADRRNRRANDDSAHLRLLLGQGAVVGGLLLLIAGAIFCVVVPLPRGLNEHDACSAVSSNRHTSVNDL
jgi:hypothetical protein